MHIILCMHLTRKGLRDLLSDSEDYSGEPRDNNIHSCNRIVHTLQPKWLAGIRTNVVVLSQFNN